jgi:pimeloyl-ACP methyl ester carboxylesterase
MVYYTDHRSTMRLHRLGRAKDMKARPDAMGLDQSHRVTTEGDDLYFEVRGQGQPLLLIAGGGGDGDYYAAIADILSDEYKVITYDRRANARSTMNYPQNVEISQQSRDAVAVMKAAGETSAFIFGNSSGAVIALDMARTQPQAVRTVVVHEPAIPRLHPQSRRWQRFFASCYSTAFRFGSFLAAIRFGLGIQVPVVKLAKAQMKAIEYAKRHRVQDEQPRISSKEGVDFLVKQELLPVTNYLPDVEKIKQNGVKVFVEVGAWALHKKTWYALTAKILAEQLGCELVTFPGHHGSYMDMPNEFAAVLRNILHKASKPNQ